MKLYKPKFWDNDENFFSILLFPLTLLYELIIFLKKKFTKLSKYNIPIICIGNIYVGGTGKTPSSILLAKELSKIGKKPAIIRKFYKNHNDEYQLIRKHFKYLILNKNRINAINQAEEENFDSVILDDGFQDYRIKKDLNIICFNQNQLIGNGFVFPSGPLRENLSALKNAQIIIINGQKNIEFERKVLSLNRNINIFYSSYKPINISEFKDKQLLALAGIGNPNNFFDLLSEHGLNVKEKLIFPDHYEFKNSEILDIINTANQNNYEIITTEKDYFRIKSYNFKEIKYLKLGLEINDLKKLIENILKIYD
jgi:tetraacyldisaccharide 4'-kinase